RVWQRFGVELPLRAVFMKPTIERLALHVLELQRPTDGGEIEALLDDLEGMAEEDAERELLKIAGQVDRPLPAKERITALPGVPDFRCPRPPSQCFGKRKCNLVIFHNEPFEAASFEKAARHVQELDPCIDVAVVRDSPSYRLTLKP